MILAKAGLLTAPVLSVTVRLNVSDVVAEVEGTITQYNRPTIDYDYPLSYPILDSGYCIGYKTPGGGVAILVFAIIVVVVARAGNSRNRILTINRDMSGQASDVP